MFLVKKYSSFGFMDIVALVSKRTKAELFLAEKNLRQEGDWYFGSEYNYKIEYIKENFNYEGNKPL